MLMATGSKRIDPVIRVPFIEAAIPCTTRPVAPPKARASPSILPSPGSAQAGRHEHQGAPAAQREPGWRHESEDARQAPRAVEVMPGDAVESRGAVLLGTLPQPVFRQPDGTSLE
jgi:hypothetical protein